MHHIVLLGLAQIHQSSKAEAAVGGGIPLHAEVMAHRIEALIAQEVGDVPSITPTTTMSILASGEDEVVPWIVVGDVKQGT